jgi:hypothetical protein
LPQNEQRIDSTDRLGPLGSSGMRCSGAQRSATHQPPTQRVSAPGAVIR